MDEQYPETPGGLGGDSVPDGPAIRDTRLQERAIRERWPMSADVRVKVLRRLCKIVDDEADHSPLRLPDHREVISASRALLSADKLNIEQEKIDLLRAREEREASAGGARRIVVEYADIDDGRDDDEGKPPAAPRGPEEHPG